jgi:hypothetical protein
MPFLHDERQLCESAVPKSNRVVSQRKVEVGVEVGVAVENEVVNEAD